jgi:hypothetical protein
MTFVGIIDVGGHYYTGLINMTFVGIIDVHIRQVVIIIQV